jgi:hypothetical protein
MRVYGSEQIDKIVAIAMRRTRSLSRRWSWRESRTRSSSSGLERVNLVGRSCAPWGSTGCPSALDWSGSPPAEIQTPEYAKVEFIISGEQEYVAACRTKYQFIFSDADHTNTQRWFNYVYENL